VTVPTTPPRHVRARRTLSRRWILETRHPEFVALLFAAGQGTEGVVVAAIVGQRDKRKYTHRFGAGAFLIVEPDGPGFECAVVEIWEVGARLKGPPWSSKRYRHERATRRCEARRWTRHVGDHPLALSALQSIFHLKVNSGDRDGSRRIGGIRGTSVPRINDPSKMLVRDDCYRTEARTALHPADNFDRKDLQFGGGFIFPRVHSSSQIWYDRLVRVCIFESPFSDNNPDQTGICRMHALNSKVLIIVVCGLAAVLVVASSVYLSIDAASFSAEMPFK
jgi:hypothetical protein